MAALNSMCAACAVADCVFLKQQWLRGQHGSSSSSCLTAGNHPSPPSEHAPSSCLTGVRHPHRGGGVVFVFASAHGILMRPPSYRALRFFPHRLLLPSFPCDLCRTALPAFFASSKSAFSSSNMHASATILLPSLPRYIASFVGCVVVVVVLWLVALVVFAASHQTTTTGVASPSRTRLPHATPPLLSSISGGLVVGGALTLTRCQIVTATAEGTERLAERKEDAQQARAARLFCAFSPHLALIHSSSYIDLLLV